MERPHFTPQNLFEIKAAKRGEYELMPLTDQYQIYRYLSFSPQQTHTITAEEIAHDFLLHTTLQGPHMSLDCRPAIFRCRGEVPEMDEIGEALEKFKRYCTLVVDEADELDRQRKAGVPSVPKITQRAKECARFMLWEKPWLMDLEPATHKRCLFCTTTIPAYTLKCPNCGEIVDRAGYETAKAAQKAAAVINGPGPALFGGKAAPPVPEGK
jgi:hypothetical protein